MPAVTVTAVFILGQWGTCSFPLALSLRTVMGHGMLCLVSECERPLKSVGLGLGGLAVWQKRVIFGVSGSWPLCCCVRQVCLQ